MMKKKKEERIDYVVSTAVGEKKAGENQLIELTRCSSSLLTHIYDSSPLLASSNYKVSFFYLDSECHSYVLT